jgi:hypothetical protein
VPGRTSNEEDYSGLSAVSPVLNGRPAAGINCGEVHDAES